MSVVRAVAGDARQVPAHPASDEHEHRRQAEDRIRAALHKGHRAALRSGHLQEGGHLDQQASGRTQRSRGTTLSLPLYSTLTPLYCLLLCFYFK